MHGIGNDHYSVYTEKEAPMLQSIQHTEPQAPITPYARNTRPPLLRVSHRRNCTRRLLLLRHGELSSYYSMHPIHGPVGTDDSEYTGK
eukprot:2389811-Pyramimonas_sp.AAC.1